MDTSKTFYSDSGIYERIRALSMTPSQRREALAALATAEALVEGFTQTGKSLRNLFGQRALRPSLKH